MKRIALLFLCTFLLAACSAKEDEKKPIKEKRNSLSISITDLSAPNISTSKDKIEVEEGATLDINEYISVVDNYDSEIVYSIKGIYDLTKAGIYELTIQAKDKAGNASNKKISVVVKGKEENKDVGPNLPTVPDIPTPPVPNPKPIVPSPPLPAPTATDFLFSNGYTMTGGSNPADTACNRYIMMNATPGYLGTCDEITGSSGMTIGMKATWIRF